MLQLIAKVQMIETSIKRNQVVYNYTMFILGKKSHAMVDTAP